MARYDYRCDRCGHTAERVMSMHADSKQPLACDQVTGAGNRRRPCPGKCRRIFTGQFQVNEKPVSSKFPYVSNRLPFGLKNEPTYGPLKKVWVKNEQHKLRLYGEHGFVKE